MYIAVFPSRERDRAHDHNVAASAKPVPLHLKVIATLHASMIIVA